MTKAERAAERARGIEALRREIPDRRTILHTHTEYTRSQTDYVHVYVVRGREIKDVTYWVALACGLRMTHRGIAMRGGNYSKALDAADSTWRARFGESLPQTRSWREI